MSDEIITEEVEPVVIPEAGFFIDGSKLYQDGVEIPRETISRMMRESGEAGKIMKQIQELQRKAQDCYKAMQVTARKVGGDNFYINLTNPEAVDVNAPFGGSEVYIVQDIGWMFRNIGYTASALAAGLSSTAPGTQLCAAAETAMIIAGK